MQLRKETKYINKIFVTLEKKSFKVLDLVWFGLVWLFNGISTYEGNLIPNTSL